MCFVIKPLASVAFSYVVVEPDDGKWGVEDSSGQWNGMIQQVVDGVGIGNDTGNHRRNWCYCLPLNVTCMTLIVVYLVIITSMTVVLSPLSTLIATTDHITVPIPIMVIKLEIYNNSSIAGLLRNSAGIAI